MSRVRIQRNDFAAVQTALDQLADRIDRMPATPPAKESASSPTVVNTTTSAPALPIAALAEQLQQPVIDALLPQIQTGIFLGETADKAYRGDRGKEAYDHAHATGNPHGTTIASIAGLVEALASKLSSIPSEYITEAELAAALLPYLKAIPSEYITEAELAQALASFTYTLPKASATVLGGVKVGANLSIDNDGVLSATGGGGSSVSATLPNITTEVVHAVLPSWVLAEGLIPQGDASNILTNGAAVASITLTPSKIGERFEIHGNVRFWNDGGAYDYAHFAVGNTLIGGWGISKNDGADPMSLYAEHVATSMDPITFNLLACASSTSVRISGDIQMWIRRVDPAYLVSVNPAPDVFSFTERLTNKIWTDGRRVWRKVVDLSTLPNNGTKTVAHGITGVASWLPPTGLYWDGTWVVFLPYAGSAPYNMALDVNGTSVVVSTNSNRSNATGLAILEYTKTDDPMVVETPNGWIQNLVDYAIADRPSGNMVDGVATRIRGYNCGKLLNNGTKVVPHDLGSLTIVGCKGKAYTDTKWLYCDLPHPHPNAPATIGVWVENGTICLATGIDRTGITAHVWLEYIPPA